MDKWRQFSTLLALSFYSPLLNPLLAADNRIVSGINVSSGGRPYICQNSCKLTHFFCLRVRRDDDPVNVSGPDLLSFSFYFGDFMRSLQGKRGTDQNGRTGYKSAVTVSFRKKERRARLNLSPEAFAYSAGGAKSECTIDFSRQATDLVKIHPKTLGGVQEVSMQLKWREHTLPAPFLYTCHPPPNHHTFHFSMTCHLHGIKDF